jgi:hypothetical protein
MARLPFHKICFCNGDKDDDQSETGRSSGSWIIRHPRAFVRCLDGLLLQRNKQYVDWKAVSADRILTSSRD